MARGKVGPKKTTIQSIAKGQKQAITRGASPSEVTAAVYGVSPTALPADRQVNLPALKRNQRG